MTKYLGSEISSDEAVEMMLLRLAALAIDLRERLTPEEIAKFPSLWVVMEACNDLLTDLGWGPLAEPLRQNRPPSLMQ
jgi:hypothetical protein